MTVAGNDILRVTVRQTDVNAGSIQNVFQFKVLSLLGEDEEVVLSDIAAIMDDFYSDLEGIILHTTDPVDIIVFNTTQDQPVGVTAFPTYTGGTASGEGLPPGVAALITFGTGVLKVLGKKYIGLLAESGSDTGVLTAGVISTLVAAAGFLVGTIIPPGSTVNYECGVVDKHGNWRKFTSFRVPGNNAYQRRRKLGRGI
jgi:hypothetical protein